MLNTIYDLLLNPGTRAFEREQLRIAKLALEQGEREAFVLARLENALRPLALRDNLTPDVTDFYQRLRGEAVAQFDFDAHAAARRGAHRERAIFAGGCFWCMVAPFDQRPGIVSVLSGYTGGQRSHPTYDQVKAGSGDVEAVEIIFDPRRISYATLLDLYFQLIDPLDGNGQLEDRGAQYRPVIFVDSQAQKAAATAKLAQEAARYQRPLAVALQPAQTFWPAENYHQEFYKKQPKRYKRILAARKRLLWFSRLRLKWATRGA